MYGKERIEHRDFKKTSQCQLQQHSHSETGGMERSVVVESVVKVRESQIR